MGNLCSLFAPPKPVKKRRPIKKRQPSLSGSGSGPNTNRLNRFRSSSSNKFDDAVTQEQALAAAAILSRQQKSGGSLPFERSASQRHPVSVSKKNQLPRSSSTRSRSSTDPLLQPHQFLNQVLSLYWLKSILLRMLTDIPLTEVLIRNQTWKLHIKWTMSSMLFCNV